LTRLWLVTLVCALGCSEPVHDRLVESFGPEATGIPEGPLHRAGQPCGECHGEFGPARQTFSLSGTIYQNSSGDEPELQLEVKVIDAQGSQRTFTTNEVGSFYATPAEYAPTFPVWVKLVRGEQIVEMRSAISRQTSCGGCHGREAAPAKVGQVYFEMPSPEAPP